MTKTKHFLFVLMLLGLALAPASCSDDDKPQSPTFGTITITPEKDVYKVGDVVTCDLKEASYWWYASWWFSDSEMKADFQDFGEDNVNTSAQITLTEAGEVTLYFFGKLDYPKFDWRKVEIGRTVTVTE